MRPIVVVGTPVAAAIRGHSPRHCCSSAMTKSSSALSVFVFMRRIYRETVNQ
jgi:hypothetical protein